ncbi:MAG: tRNA (adenosine(37)-N6)-threonylcarbamoyltransferase complex ATPase subunit type 1 TsaE [Bdellovibrionales bacterium]|nr:tRNA (adenosine(37)-N6)-threonylcarbamoyltransferase complex ATPase subunit type 1 TsaE [Bdellovibrionales bacterium]
MSQMISEVELERVTVHSLEELRTFWIRALEKYFGPRTLCLLIGPMGAGKTECLKQVSQIGHFGEVASPSFAIHHRTKNSQGKTLDHVDLFPASFARTCFRNSLVCISAKLSACGVFAALRPEAYTIPTIFPSNKRGVIVK